MGTSTRFNLKFLHTFSKKKRHPKKLQFTQISTKKVNVVIYTEGG